MRKNSQKVMAGVTTTTLVEPLMLLSHQGGPGIIVGLGLGIAAYLGAGEVHTWRERMGLSQPEVAPASGTLKLARNRKKSGQPSFWHRALVGRSVREAQAPLIEDEQEDAPIEEYLLELGDLRPHVNSVLSNRVVVLGMSGAGKSNVVADFVEELGRYDAPLVLFDKKGEYERLCDRLYLTRPVHVTAQNLTPQNARAFARQIMDERLQVVIDLTTYRDVDAALVMTEIIRTIYAYQVALKKEDRVPCTFILEEAHYWLPQDQSQSTLRGIKNRGDENEQTLLAHVQQTFFGLATRGRYLGMGLIVATQRAADVDNRLIGSAEWYFLLKAMLPADLARYKAFGAPDGVAQRLNPKQGDAYIIGPDGIMDTYHIRLRYSPDDSPTPGLANIRNAARYSHSPVGVGFERGNVFENDENVNENKAGNSLGSRENAREYSLPPREYSPPVENDGPDYTPAEESRVLLAYADLRAEYRDRPVPRTAIRDRLDWDNRRYARIIKPVCDKHGIA